MCEHISFAHSFLYLYIPSSLSVCVCEYLNANSCSRCCHGMGGPVFVSVSSLASRPNTDLMIFSKQSQHTLISLLLPNFFSHLCLSLYAIYTRLFIHSFSLFQFSLLDFANEKGSNDLTSHLSSHSTLNAFLLLLFAHPLFLAHFPFSFRFLYIYGSASTRNLYLFNGIK